MDESRIFKLRWKCGERYSASPKSQPFERRLNQLVLFSLATQENKEILLMKYLKHLDVLNPREGDIVGKGEDDCGS